MERNPMTDTYPFTSPFWVWMKPETPERSSHIQNNQQWSGGYHWSPFKVATPIMSISSTPPFDVKIIGLAPASYLRLSLVDQLFEMRINSAFSNNSRIFRISNQFISMVKLFDINNSVLNCNFHAKHIQPSNIQ